MFVFILTFDYPSMSRMSKSDEMVDGERKVHSKYSNNVERYSSYLFDESAYTAKGFEYTNKYRQLILLLCADLIETHKFNLGSPSIGFYTDKIAFEKEKYYLGIEFIFPDSDRRTYEAAAAQLASAHLRKITTSLSSSYKIFEDPNVAGAVLRFTWKRQGQKEFVDFWLSSRDVYLFQTNRMVLPELIMRSTITNMNGVIIRLSV